MVFQFTVVCLSLCLSSVTYYILAKRCIRQQKSLLTAYEVVCEESIDTKITDLDFCLEVA